ncbi:unnamed protein product [Linum trigynum]|uniref:Uncharacterized protein n=1 Tax=Linum trigynum TaxID=586398 RepID=A0AAV2GDF2_9ROSI
MVSAACTSIVSPVGESPRFVGAGGLSTCIPASRSPVDAFGGLSPAPVDVVTSVKSWQLSGGRPEGIELSAGIAIREELIANPSNPCSSSS